MHLQRLSRSNQQGVNDGRRFVDRCADGIGALYLAHGTFGGILALRMHDAERLEHAGPGARAARRTVPAGQASHGVHRHRRRARARIGLLRALDAAQLPAILSMPFWGFSFLFISWMGTSEVCRDRWRD